MKTMTMTEFRASPGERIIDVIRERETFIITKAGKPVAKLGPVDDSIVIERNGRVRGEMPLTHGAQGAKLLRATQHRPGGGAT